MNYSDLSHFQWIRVDANILETMPRKTEKKRDCFGTCGQGLICQSLNVFGLFTRNVSIGRSFLCSGPRSGTLGSKRLVTAALMILLSYCFWSALTLIVCW